MGEVKFNFEQYDGQIAKACMERLRKAAEVIADEMRNKYDQLDIEGMRHIGGMRFRSSSFFHGPYRTGAYAGVFWTARIPRAMRDTIRVREKKEQSGISVLVGRDVRVYVGNKKTWWAIQMEYGRGGWKGGRKSFVRPALRSSKAAVQRIIANG